MADLSLSRSSHSQTPTAAPPRSTSLPLTPTYWTRRVSILPPFNRRLNRRRDRDLRRPPHRQVSASSLPVATQRCGLRGRRRRKATASSLPSTAVLVCAIRGRRYRKVTASSVPRRLVAATVCRTGTPKTRPTLRAEKRSERGELQQAVAGRRKGTRLHVTHPPITVIQITYKYNLYLT